MHVINSKTFFFRGCCYARKASDLTRLTAKLSRNGKANIWAELRCGLSRRTRALNLLIGATRLVKKRNANEGTV